MRDDLSRLHVHVPRGKPRFPWLVALGLIVVIAGVSVALAVNENEAKEAPIFFR